MALNQVAVETEITCKRANSRHPDNVYDYNINKVGGGAGI